MNNYDHKAIELKWQSRWKENKINEIELDNALKPFYVLMMFPYPSAEGLHIGSVYTFTGIDTYSRFKRMQGYNVFEPFGLDGFGIHSENFAIKIKENILDVSKRTQKHYYDQMGRTGNMIDWSRKLETYNPDYYKWTQWLFVQLFKAGLAYRKKADVNWCPSCKTVLSDEQVINKECERCGTEVIRKSMDQWFFKITKYVDRLLSNLEELDWVDDVKIGQKNWIGKKEGLEIDYVLLDDEGKKTKDLLTVFTTRPDTNYGATFVVISPEHPKLRSITKSENKKAVEEYVKASKKKSDIERTDLSKEKTGVFTGSYCYSRLTNTKLPIWVADFVLMDLGTGAVVGVPGHDKKDFEFAKNHDIPVLRVVTDGKKESEITEISQVLEDYGIVINSDFLNGLDSATAKEKIIRKIEERKEGRKTINYRLRDWCVSRQRYWGPPIPMIFCESCNNRHEGYYDIEMPGWWPDENLPILLPKLENIEDTLPDGSGKGTLARVPSFYEVKCPHCGSSATRETDVLDSFVDSSWYFLRYLFTEYSEIPFGGDFNNKKSLFKPELPIAQEKKAEARMKNWAPVTIYIGGREHTVLHLLYARFITMVFHDLGYLDFEEPFTRLYAHGLITKDGAKMSKSKGNIINPDEYFDRYGADAVRMYLRFMGPFDQGGDWSDSGMQGMYRFINKVYRLYDIESLDTKITIDIDTSFVDRVIEKITSDLDNLKFNTAVAEIMKLINWYTARVDKMPKKQKLEILEKLLLLMAPFIPHLTEELWTVLGYKDSIHLQSWPIYDKVKSKKSISQIPVQIDGKVRGTILVKDSDIKEDILINIRKDSKLIKYIKTKKPRQFIYIENKIVSIVN